jgi:hydrogenase expression/formation protein HypE
MNDKNSLDLSAGFSCPIPLTDYPYVLLAHGGGGKLSQRLIGSMFVDQFKNEFLDTLHDGAVFEVKAGRLAFSTDSYVVKPIFFPGGSIGELAVNGTVNDLAMCGAEPKYISVGMIIEEGLPMEELWRVVQAMGNAAKQAGVRIVTGDTKVVDKGKGDKIFINTSGIGIVPPGIEIDPRRAQPGDKIMINGEIAAHGIAIMSVREGLEFESPIISDTAPLNSLVGAMLAAGRIHVLRDPTRGGVATVLNEIAEQSGVGIELDEDSIPVGDEVKGACEILGFDPLYVANEGKLIAFVPPQEAEKVLAAMKRHPLGVHSSIIGEVVAHHPKRVVLKSKITGTRIVDMLSGEQLPRIC